jgi:hypothetical protein
MILAIENASQAAPFEPLTGDRGTAPTIDVGS